MRNRRNEARRRAATAYDILRGRPARLDYGILVVLPLIAAAGGTLIALYVDQVVTRRAARRPKVAVLEVAADEPVSTR